MHLMPRFPHHPSHDTHRRVTLSTLELQRRVTGSTNRSELNAAFVEAVAELEVGWYS